MDIADQADDVIAMNLAQSVAYRKPVSTTREDCDEPCAILPNGARARFCYHHLVEFQAAL